MVEKVLDACCGARMCWFDKHHPEVVYADNRRLVERLTNGQLLRVDPDLRMDFRQMLFPDEYFSLVLFDPPHVFSGPNSWITKKYGKLEWSTWRTDIKQGFCECFRVLKHDGTLVFKWNEEKIKLSDVLALAPYRPLFGHRGGKAMKTIWVTFLKTDASEIKTLDL